MQLVMLEASVPLTKRFEKKSDGTITKTSYPHVYDVSSHHIDVRNLQDFERALVKHAALGHCLVKGNISRQLVKESRAGTTNTNDSTEWVVFDLDGLPDSETVDSFLALIGLKDVSYIVQYSASHLVTDKKLRAHVFMMLDKAYPAPLLKQWLVGINHDTPMLSQSMALTKTGNALLWPLDISACQNDKLIYIAPPTLKGIKDPHGKQRISLVKRKKDKLSIADTIPSTAKNRERTSKRIDELREKDGLPKRKTTYKMHGAMEVLVKPDVCTITEMKQERGFVYFNLNGGDSWAYYHPEDNPDYIFNFKGEPVYLTKELLPEYWQQITGTAARVSSSGLIYLAFLDRKTSTYYRGTYDATLDELDLNPAKNETQVRHFAKQHGVPLGDYIPEWDLVFDPHDNVRVDLTTRVANLFQLTTFMKASTKKVTTIPKNCHKVIWHALGEDQEIYEHFINWLAFIVQFRDRTKTAWVLHGTQGTGKGVMMNKIIRPLLGEKQTATRRMEEFEERYNHFMKQCFVVFVDEVETGALKNESGVIAKFKNFITEPMVPIREMHAQAKEFPNYTNWILASNKSAVVRIDPEDRRFNVGKYQPVPLKQVMTMGEVDQIDSELQSMYDYLLHYPCNAQTASTVLDTEDRQNMISLSVTSFDTVGAALEVGDFEFFIDQLPTTETYMGNAAEINRVEDYKAVLKGIYERTDTKNGECNISREELRTIFEYTVGNIPNSPNKFTTMLKHHRIHVTKVWIAPKTVNGIKIMWKDTKKWATHQSALYPKPTSKPALKKVK